MTNNNLYATPLNPLRANTPSHTLTFVEWIEYCFLRRRIKKVGGFCWHCHRPWSTSGIKPHILRHRTSGGSLVTCTSCWPGLQDFQKLKYFRFLMRIWLTTPNSSKETRTKHLAEWSSIVGAIRAGL